MLAFKEDYTISHDWEGKRYLGLNLDWDYDNRVVTVSMPEYFENALQRFHHVQSKKPHNKPHPHLAPKYGAKQHHTEAAETLPALNKKDTKVISKRW